MIKINLRKILVFIGFIITFYVIYITFNPNPQSFSKIMKRLPETAKIVIEPKSIIITDNEEISKIVDILLKSKKDYTGVPFAGVKNKYKLLLYDKDNKKVLELECIPNISFAGKPYRITLESKELEDLKETIEFYVSSS